MSESIKHYVKRFELRLTPARLVVAIVAALVFLGSVTYLDEEREARASFADFGSEQVEVAHAAAAALSASFEGREAPIEIEDGLREAALRLRALAQPHEVAVLIRAPSMKAGLLDLDGVLVSSHAIETRLSSGAVDGAVVALTHADAVALGLPARMAVAGVAEIRRPEGPWLVVVAATARRERDREERGLWRVAVGFVLAAAIVITFGTLALRIQRAELDLVRRLAVAEAIQALDERLGRADKLATLGALAMGIVHQVATPLSVIVVRAERLAARVAGDDRARRAVAAILEQAHRIHAIARGFLRLARGGVPSLERVQPGAIARDAVELVRHRFERAGVSLRYEEQGATSLIACDPRLFEQVIVNLLLNGCDACAASGGGQVVLEVRASPQAVAFVVDDDGVGITEAAARRATEPFFTTKPPEQGTGLGLTIASEIVTHHHGTLVLEPRAARGTRARVELPAAMTDDRP